ncbi:hypothetical protein VTH8203_00857 [Vibrio thalassae]|uniref:Uncharacterized protein n=1 Tax=Vibrio thalassae TaxID=1243014 RepID=A0A240EFC7_9VIBR|nr:toprim domain-containing protein [Vibrio thalassae]SNX47256.1 hypothetical protein VTH8203_00857 [Vibrio thalassae]
MQQNKDYSAVNEQFRTACEAYGWLNILSEMTPLEGAVKYVGTTNSRRFDVCPDAKCSGHKVKGRGTGKAGNFALFKDESGAGYCFKCRQKHSPMDTIMLFKGWDFATAAKEVKHHIGFTIDPHYKPAPVKTRIPRGPSTREIALADKNRKAMNRVWLESLPLDDPKALPVAKYFAKRGITKLHSLMKGDVKMHPALPFYLPIWHSSEDEDELDKENRLWLIDYCKNHPSFEKFYIKDGEPSSAHMGFHPAIVALVRTPEGKAQRVHRIFLDNDGNKASFSKEGFEVKKMMSGGYGLEVNGCSCHIDPPQEVVGIGEGLETVLAVKQVTGMPMDCTINAGLMKDYVPRKGTKLVFIFEDKDRSKTGEIVAMELEERLLQQGIAVIRLSPPIELGDAKSKDWLDVLNQLGPEGFPEVAKQWSEFSKVG